MNDRLLRALRREPVDRTPVWFMRQAGRCLPRYRELRQERGMFEIIRDPEAAADITALPLDYFPVDAAVLYNDLSTPFLAAGLDVELRSGVGPVTTPALRSTSQVDLLHPFEPRSALDFTLEAIRLLVKRLDVPVLGFVGAPFTLASYLLEGSRRRRLERARALMWREPEGWSRLMEFWSRHLAAYAVAQHEAGAAAIQVFDSWAGVLAPEDYTEHVLPHSRALFRTLSEHGVTSIHFATGNPRLLPLLAEAGGDAIGVDWRIPIDEAWELVGEDRAVQGNLDPAALLAGSDVAVSRARSVLERISGRPGHVFNLGHGILPDTSPDVIRSVVEAVHAF